MSLRFQLPIQRSVNLFGSQFNQTNLFITQLSLFRTLLHEHLPLLYPKDHLVF